MRISQKYIGKKWNVAISTKYYSYVISSYDINGDNKKSKLIMTVHETF